MDTTGTRAGVSEASGTVARTVNQATTGAHHAIDKASDAARPAVDRLACGAHQAVDKMAGAATQAAETLDLRGEQLMNAQTRLTENCREYVRDNPVTSLGIAVAAGFLLSRLLGPR